MAGFREFLTGEVLTAANVNNFLMKQSVMVFADAAARTAALGAEVAEGMLTYNLDTGSLEVFDGAAFGPVVTAKEKRIEAFTGSGTFTVPAGVTYAIAHMLGGGGGCGGGSPANGGDSSVAFASGTVTGPGQSKAPTPRSTSNTNAVAGTANTGQGASIRDSDGTGTGGQSPGPSGVFTVAGADVTPAASITVTVGAGGAAGTSGAAGGSGYVYIEYSPQ